MESKQVKAKLKELNDYFRDKIVAGDYEIIKRDEHVYTVKINGFIFNLWVANGDGHFKTYDGYFNTMEIKFRVADQRKAFAIIKKDRAETLEKEKEEAELKELERLKAKFGE